jgi:hypothetical protein
VVLVSDISLTFDDVCNHATPGSTFFNSWKTVIDSVHYGIYGGTGDVLMQCPLVERLGDRVGHGVFRSTKYTKGLPYRVELNPNGTMKTKKEDAKNGTLHFNCPCHHHYRNPPPINSALQEVLDELCQPAYAQPTQTAINLNKSSHAAVAMVGMAAAVKTGGRKRKLSAKAQLVYDAQTDKEEEANAQQPGAMGTDQRKCWKLNSNDKVCTKQVYNNIALGGLCTVHARAAVAELVHFIKNTYIHYSQGSASLLDHAVSASEQYLLDKRSSVVTSRKLYVNLLHELRFHFLRAEKKK